MPASQYHGTLQILIAFYHYHGSYTLQNFELLGYIPVPLLDDFTSYYINEDDEETLNYSVNETDVTVLDLLK